jgi:hypothetical protein
MTLESIKAAIEELPETERASLAAWLVRLDSEAWDREIEADFSEGGAGTLLVEKWDAEIKSGSTIPLDDFLSQEEDRRKAK